LTATLEEAASVTWLLQSDASVIRARYRDERVEPGQLSWTWDGTDADGRPVPDGTYSVIIGATTDVGTQRYVSTVHVGPAQWTLSDETPRRGERLTITVRSTEPLERRPTLEVAQPGIGTYRLTMRRLSPWRSTVTFRVHDRGRAGAMRIALVARDAAGQTERWSRSVRIG
jgi:hypothetical protein